MKESKATLGQTLHRFLLSLVIILLVILIGGTVFALLGRSDTEAAQPLITLGGQTTGEANGALIFTGIGRLRIQTSDNPPAVVILTVTFPYDSSDRAFQEELVLRIGDFRGIITSYMGAYRAQDLAWLPEEQVKEAILSQFNGLLLLGQIELLYFTDFDIIW